MDLLTASPSPTLPPPSRVPSEFVGKARSLRDRIIRATEQFEEAADRALYPLRPRPAWPAPGRGDWLNGLVGRYRSIKSICRLDLHSRIEPNGCLTLTEVTVVASRIARPHWTEDEPALSCRGPGYRITSLYSRAPALGRCRAACLGEKISARLERR
jgi:hypothetical protein